MQKREVTKIAEQILTAERTTLNLNTEALQKVLKHPDCRDLPVVVICLAGPFRSGKSFFLNLFLHYIVRQTINFKGCCFGFI